MIPSNPTRGRLGLTPFRAATSLVAVVVFMEISFRKARRRGESEQVARTARFLCCRSHRVIVKSHTPSIPRNRTFLQSLTFLIVSGNNRTVSPMEGRRSPRPTVQNARGRRRTSGRSSPKEDSRVQEGVCPRYGSDGARVVVGLVMARRASPRAAPPRSRSASPRSARRAAGARPIPSRSRTRPRRPGSS